MTRKIAVVLFNLGGPDGPEAVRPFLFNLFNDPAIIALPGLIRTPLAKMISSRREESAKANYALMGGASPLLPETRAQAGALEAALKADMAADGDEVRCFIAMRYWHPFSEETAAEVAAFAPDEIVLTPLYPQYSTTTTGSSLAAWRRVYRGPGRSRAICCYPTLEGLAAAHAAKIEAAHAAAGCVGPTRLLFSAHGLPEKVVQRGDPYQAQIEATAAAIVAKLSGQWDWRISYQSRVGPMKWIGPSTDIEIAAASEAGLNLVVVPIAFVSEHIETLVELDHEYGAMARRKGCPAYVRVPALGIEPAFVEALAGAVRTALARPGGVAPVGDWTCGAGFKQCPRTMETERAP